MEDREKRAMPRLLSVNVGLPRDVAWRGKTVHTAVWKTPVQGRRVARRLNIDGDGQGDLVGHGGEHRAVFVYQIDSYRYWQAQLRCRLPARAGGAACRGQCADLLLPTAGRHRHRPLNYSSLCGTLSPGSWSGLAFDHRTGDKALRG